MPRPMKNRCVAGEPISVVYKPAGVPTRQLSGLRWHWTSLKRSVCWIISVWTNSRPLRKWAFPVRPSRGFMHRPEKNRRRTGARPGHPDRRRPGGITCAVAGTLRYGTRSRQTQRAMRTTITTVHQQNTGDKK